MTIQEKIKLLKNLTFKDDTNCMNEARDTAIESMEKQIPKKVVNRGQGHGAECMCPNCGKYLGDDADWHYDQTKYCNNCGQALEEY